MKTVLGKNFKIFKKRIKVFVGFEIPNFSTP